MLKALTGGISPGEAAWEAMQKGRKLKSGQIKMYVALDAEPGEGLKSALTALAAEHDLSIGVISVLGRDRLEVWEPV